MAKTPDFETDPLYEEFQRDFSSEWMSHPVKLDTDALTMWCVASAIQLACRHPSFTGPTAHHAQRFAEIIFEKIAMTPALKEVAEKGWNSDFDH